MTFTVPATVHQMGATRRRSRSSSSLLALLALSFVLWRPVSGGEILYPVLAVLAAASLPRFKKPSRWMFQLALLYVTTVLIMMFVGSLRDAPGLGHQSAVWVGGMVIWFLWGNSLTVANIRTVLSVIFVVTIVSATAMVLYVLAQKGILPQLIPSSVLEGQGAGFGENQLGTEIRFYGLSTLAGAGPLAAAGAFAPRATLLPARGLMLLAAGSSALAVTVAGRQAILVVTLLAPLMLLAIYRLLADRTGRPSRVPPWLVIGSPVIFLLAVVIAGTAVLGQIGIALSDGAYVFAGIGTPQNVSSNLRASQAKELVSAWGDHPLFGAGLGAILESGYARNYERPWMFELQYHQLLFNGGLIAAIFGLAILAMVFAGAKAAVRVMPLERSTLAVVLVGALGMSAANASNPYLQAIGHWWAVALGLGVIGAVLRHTTSGCARATSSPAHLRNHIT